MSNVENAKQGIATLLEVMSIVKIVCVDDYYEITPRKAAQLIIPLKGKTSIFTDIPEFNQIDFDDEMTYILEEIEKEFSIIDQSRLQEIYQYLYEQQPETSDYYLNSPQLMMQLFQDIDFIALSPTEWYAQKDKLIHEGSDGRILFLFDRQLNGTREDEGMRIIQDIILNEKEKIICGLLSSHFTPEEEYSKWEEYASAYEIDKDSFLLISKLHKSLSDSAQMIKLIVLNRLYSHFRNQVIDSINKAVDFAKQNINEIDVYDFEHMVFKTSGSEGVWEPDTLLRIFNIHQRRRVLELMRENPDVKDTAFRIRKASGVNISNKATPSEYVFETMQFELYEESQHLNTYHLPLELGDIFETTHTDTPQRYILLTQPCDLMVRKEGERRINEAIIARIFNIEEKSLPMNSISYFKLPYYDPQNIYYVNFSRTSIVNLWVLDTCVYHSEGWGKYKLDPNIPVGLIPSWSNRYNKAQKYFIKSLANYKKYDNQLPKSILESTFIPASSKDNVFKGNLNLEEDLIDYQFKRIRRLCKAYASELLLRYGDYLTRSAFDHELDRGL